MKYILGFILGCIALPSYADAVCYETYLSRASLAPLSYIARYEGLSAEVTREVNRLEKGQWKLDQQLKMMLVGITETSVVRNTNKGVETLAYSFNQSGLGAREYTINVDPNTYLAEVYRKGQASTYQGVSDMVDTQSHILQLQLQLSCSASPANQYSFNLVKRGGVREYTYNFVSNQTLKLDDGQELEAQLWERTKDDTVDRLWLASKQDYRLVRFQHREGDKVSELRIRSTI